MSSVGRISLDLSINNRGFNNQVNGIKKQTTKAFNSMSVAVGNIMANMAQRAVAEIGNFVKQSIDKGSELAELQNVVDSVFTTMSDRVESFSKSALENYGLTEAQAKKMVGTYGAMSKSFGYTEAQAYDMSAALTGLTADVASFYNLSHDEAYTKMKSVFTGETESLKELGVVMTQTALEEYALQKGIQKSINNMSEQEKVALRFSFVQDKLATASGDFIRTQDQWANQTRILKGQYESLQATLGQGFINVLTPVIRHVNTLMSKLIQLAGVFKSFTESLMGSKGEGSAGAAMAEVAKAADEAAGSTGGIENAANGAAKAAKTAQKALMGFDEINKLTKSDSSSSSSGGDLGLLNFGTPIEDATDKATGFDGIAIKISDRFKGITSEISRAKDMVLDFGGALATIFSAFTGGSAKKIGADLVDMITTTSLGLVELATKIGSDLLNFITKPFVDNQDAIKLALENTLAPISILTDTISNSVTATFTKIFEVYEAYVRPAFESFTNGVSQIAGALLNAYNTHMAPILDSLANKFSELWSSTVQPIINKAIEIVGKVIEVIQILWETILLPLTLWLVDTFAPIFAESFKRTGEFIFTFVEKVMGVISGLLTALEGIIDFIAGVFTGDWKRAWGGVQSIFSGIFETIKSIVSTAMYAIKSVIDVVLEAISKAISTVLNGVWSFIKGIINTILGGIESLVNGVIGGFNNMIKAMNKLSFDVPDWVPGIGGSKFGFNLKEMKTASLPRLAEGGYVRANQPQPVIVGDNKTQGEIISPEDKMLSVMMQALEQFFGRLRDIGYNAGGNNDTGDIVIPIYLDGSLLDEVIVTAQQRRALRSGGY